MTTYLIPPVQRRTSLIHIWDEASHHSLCVARVKVRSLWASVDPAIHTRWSLTEKRGKLAICKVCRRKWEKHNKNAPKPLPMASREVLDKPWSEYTPPGQHYCWAYSERHR